MKKVSVKIHDPLAEHLGDPAEVVEFEITIYDAARLAGHLCPSIAGAFLMTRAAVHALFPENETCIRGQMLVDLPTANDEGAMGPMSHVVSYVTGAWAEDGFKGLSGQFKRRNLLRFDSERCRDGSFRFERTDNGKAVHVHYRPERASFDRNASDPWQARVEAILSQADSVVDVSAEN